MTIIFTIGQGRVTVKLLADTSALLALIWKNDANHPRAARFVREHAGNRYVITELILSETVTRLRARADAKAAVAAADSLLGSRRYELVFCDSALLTGGLARMALHADKRLSLPDCVSFEVIERLGLDGAFTFDTDFRDCGVTAYP